MDLTPHYVNPEEAQQFHQSLKQLCDAYDKGAYAAWKKNADEYFYAPHRKEHRGIGGIFFDKLSRPKTKHFDLINSLAQQFTPIYKPLIINNRDKPFGASEICLLYTSPSPRDRQKSRMPSSA